MFQLACPVHRSPFVWKHSNDALCALPDDLSGMRGPKLRLQTRTLWRAQLAFPASASIPRAFRFSGALNDPCRHAEPMRLYNVGIIDPQALYMPLH